jgi:cobalt-zinc-cadmium resistance protein CzcA
MPPSTSDGYVMLKPRKEWPDPEKPKAAVVHDIQEAVEEVPGNVYEISQPIQQRMNELISGVRSDVGVKIFGDDLDVLVQSAARVQAVLQNVQGAADVKTEQASGLPVLTVKLNRQALSRYGISVGDVQNLVEIAVDEREVGKNEVRGCEQADGNHAQRRQDLDKGRSTPEGHITGWRRVPSDD